MKLTIGFDLEVKPEYTKSPGHNAGAGLQPLIETLCLALVLSLQKNPSRLHNREGNLNALIVGGWLMAVTLCFIPSSWFPDIRHTTEIRVP